jgi:hypothetical protein
MTAEHLLFLCRNLNPRQTLLLTDDEAKALFGKASAASAIIFLGSRLSDADSTGFEVKEMRGAIFISRL